MRVVETGVYAPPHLLPAHGDRFSLPRQRAQPSAAR